MLFLFIHKKITIIYYIIKMNSKSDIIDELNTLKTSNVLKTKTLDDIIEKNVKSIEQMIDSKVINIYARPWVKLEPKLKLRKINEFFTNNDEYENDTQEKIRKYYLDKKKVVVKYDVELCSVESIKTNF